MAEAPPAPAASRSRSGGRPTLRVQIINIVLLHIAWFAVVLGAAHDLPVWGTATVVASFAWHLWVSARPAEEVRLVAAVCAAGFLLETLNVHIGFLNYTSGQPDPNLPPYWIVALWGLLAITLNVTMRFLKHRLWLAALLGAVVGPLSFVSGVRLGGATFVNEHLGVAVLAIGWAVLMPVLMWLSNRFDGVGVPAPDAGTSHA